MVMGRTVPVLDIMAVCMAAEVADLVLGERRKLCSQMGKSGGSGPSVRMRMCGSEGSHLFTLGPSFADLLP